MQDRIARCVAMREQVSVIVAELLAHSREWSETDFKKALQQKLQADTSLWPTGWYDPPPGGIAALFSGNEDYTRLQFDTLRKEEFWPKPENILRKGSAGMIYAGPVDRHTGMIGDWGATIYSGPDPEVRSHFKNCLGAMEEALEQIAVNMEFHQIHDTAQKIFKTRHLTNERTIVFHGKTGTNLGHTVPWSYEVPTSDEQDIINAGDFVALKTMISGKRITVNSSETFKIPETIAFTFEARLEDSENPKIPNVFFHYIVTFQEGKKEIFANFNEIFATVGMDYLRSKY
jgi:hypothetical protein